MSRRVVVAVLLALLVITAGCVGDDSSDGDSIERQGGDAADPNGDGSGDAVESMVSSLDREDRQIIRTASLEVTVDSLESARSNLTEEADALGGYLSEAEERTHGSENETWQRGTFTYRVPAAEFEAFYATADAQGTVRHAETDTEDVTDQLVDLEARLDNLEDQRDRLRELYEDAEDTDEVLAVEERLSSVQEEIERLEAEREALTDRVAYSTVTVALSEEEPDTAESEVAAWYEESVLAAFVASVGGVGTVARASVVALAYALPYVLAFGTPVALLYGANRRFRRPSSTVDSSLGRANGDGTETENRTREAGDEPDEAGRIDEADE